MAVLCSAWPAGPVLGSIYGRRHTGVRGSPAADNRPIALRCHARHYALSAKGESIEITHLVDTINLMLPEPIIAPHGDRDAVDLLTEQYGAPEVRETENGLTELVFEVRDLHELRLTKDRDGFVIAVALRQRGEAPDALCPEVGWLKLNVRASGTGTGSYRGLKIGFLSGIARARAEDAASKALAAAVAALLPTLCPGACPPPCTCIPKAITAPAAFVAHTTAWWKFIPIGGTWNVTMTRFLDAYCK